MAYSTAKRDDIVFAYVPSELLHLFDDQNAYEATTMFPVFSKLTSYLTKEDIFYFIHSQSKHTNFTNFINEFNLENVVNLRSNVSWLNDVKNEYENYEKLKQDQETVTLSKDNINPKDYNFELIGIRLHAPTNTTVVFITTLTPTDDLTKSDIIEDFKSSLSWMLSECIGDLTLIKLPISKFVNAVPCVVK